MRALQICGETGAHAFQPVDESLPGEDFCNVTIASLVLVVEPDEAALSNMVWAFRQAGQQVLGVTSFEEAKRQILLNPVDVIVSQARLGLFNGLHLAHLARSQNPRVLPVILNEQPDPALEQEIVALGGTFVPGPVSSDALASLVVLLVGSGGATSARPGGLGNQINGN
jgi:DNA-binding NtrC family response regulator